VNLPAHSDELVRTVSSDGLLAVRAIVGTGLVAEAEQRHHTSPTATAALGRALMGAALLGADARDEETVQLQFRGDGPLGALTVVGESDGRVRGFAANPRADVPLRDGKLDVGRAVGKGTLAVVRYHPSWREPYRGIVPLTTGEVAEDIAGYLLESEQRPSAVALGVYVAADGSVEAAGGFAVHVLPGASDDVLSQLQANVGALESPTQMLRAGLRADDILDRLLVKLGARERLRSRPAFACGCGRERMLRGVVLLGREELRDIAASGERLEVRCEFCRDEYVLSPEEVGALVPDA
jgi:molecular chaperone Hsp33